MSSYTKLFTITALITINFNVIKHILPKMLINTFITFYSTRLIVKVPQITAYLYSKDYYS